MSVLAREIIELNAIDEELNAITLSIDDLDLFINGGYVVETTVETTSQYTEDSIHCDKAVFFEKTGGEFGEYVFSYSGSVWELDGSTVDLIEYGIELDATPDDGDTITAILVKVDGAMNDINEQYQSLSETVDANEAKASADLESAQEELQEAIDTCSDAIVQTQNSLDAISTKTQSMGWSDIPGLVLYAPGATADTGYKLQLAAQAINFRDGALGNTSSILASIAADQTTGQVFMMIADAIIKNQLRFGNFAFIPRSNGNMCLKYLG